MSAQFQLPSIWFIIGATGDGKTYLMHQILRKLDSGAYESRYGAPKEEMFQRVLYVCTYGGIRASSDDPTHMENLEKFQGLKVPVIIKEYGMEEDKAAEEAGVDALDAEDMTQEDYEELAKKTNPSKLFGMILMQLSKDIRRGDLIVFDDVQQFIDKLDMTGLVMLERLIFAKVHHQSVSVMFLLQRAPSGKNILNGLINQANYVIYMTRNGFNFSEVLKIFGGLTGRSAIIANELRQYADKDESPAKKKQKLTLKEPTLPINTRKDRPNFILCNKSATLYYPEDFGLNE